MRQDVKGNGEASKELIKLVIPVKQVLELNEVAQEVLKNREEPFLQVFR